MREVWNREAPSLVVRSPAHAMVSVDKKKTAALKGTQYTKKRKDVVPKADGPKKRLKHDGSRAAPPRSAPAPEKCALSMLLASAQRCRAADVNIFTCLQERHKRSAISKDRQEEEETGRHSGMAT